MTPPKRQKQEQEKEIQQQAYEATLAQQWKNLREVHFIAEMVKL